MRAQKLFRQIHHWGAIVIAPVLIVMIGSGLLLMLKKDIAWIQPPTQRGEAVEIAPETTLAALFEAAAGVPEAGIAGWDDLDRFDIKPDKGVAKLISTSRWEVQVDLQTREVLAVEYRRSDLIESIHDGTFFADPAKLFLFFPVGLGLLILWLTGVYLFFLPHVKKALNRRRRESRAAPAVQTGDLP